MTEVEQQVMRRACVTQGRVGQGVDQAESLENLLVERGRVTECGSSDTSWQRRTRVGVIGSCKRTSGQQEELCVGEQRKTKIRQDVETQVRWEMKLGLLDLLLPFLARK